MENSPNTTWDASVPSTATNKRTRTSSLDSDSNWSIWGSASEYSFPAHSRRRLSEDGLAFRLMGNKQSRDMSEDEDETSCAEENWESDNATADENSEMFEGDDLDMVGWSEDEEQNDVEVSRIDSGSSPGISIVSPFTPIATPAEAAAQKSRRRRRAARKMEVEINDLGAKVRKLGNGCGGDSLIDIAISASKTPFKRGAIDSIGYISEASSSSRSSSRMTSNFPHSHLPSSGENGEQINPDWTGKRGQCLQHRFAGDITHSECILSADEDSPICS